MAKSFSSKIDPGKGAVTGHSKTSNFSTQTVSGQDKKSAKRSRPIFSDRIQKVDKFQTVGGMAIVREQLAKSKEIRERKKILEEAKKLVNNPEELEEMGVNLKILKTTFGYVINTLRARNIDVTNDMIASTLEKMLGNEKLDDDETSVLKIGFKSLYARAKQRGQTAYSEKNIVQAGNYYHRSCGWY